MQADSLKFLKDLMEQPSPSGFETPGQKIIRARMKKFADTVRTDVHGNVFGVLNPKAPVRVMLSGHADEIGLMITHIDDKGFIYFADVGGWDAPVALGQRVSIRNRRGDVRGVIGRKAIHLMAPDDRGKGVKLDDLWIDIGAKDRKDALQAVEIGDSVVVVGEFMELRNGFLAGRAFDDRAGAWAITETLAALRGKKLNVAVHAVATVQEEVGLRGAVTSAYSVQPHIGIAVDVGHTADYPGGDPKKTGDIGVGRGPILHRGPNINPVLGQMLCATARRRRIKFQMQSEPRGTGTDANAMQLSRGGCAAALVSIPNRYMHSPVEVVALRDLDDTVKILSETILALTGRESFIPE